MITNWHSSPELAQAGGGRLSCSSDQQSCVLQVTSVDRCRGGCVPCPESQGMWLCLGPWVVPTCKVTVSRWLPVPSTCSQCHVLVAHCWMQEPSTGLHCPGPRVCHSPITSPVGGVDGICFQEDSVGLVGQPQCILPSPPV